MTFKPYESHLNKGLSFHLQSYRDDVDSWGSNSRFPGQLAQATARAYALTGEERFREITLELLDFYYRRDNSSGAGLFEGLFYARAVAYLVKGPDPSIPDTVAEMLAGGCADIMTWPEWGAMNRAVMRALTLELTAGILPGHRDSGDWKKMAAIIASDSIGSWEGEDSTLYQGIWLITLFEYAEACGDEEILFCPQIRYYLDYFLSLITPLNSLPEFGDSDWPEQPFRWIAIYEKAAAVYGDSRYKWAARRFWDLQMELGPEVYNPELLDALGVALDWSSDSIAPSAPVLTSGPVIDEVIGKKIVFQSGMERNSTYLLLNYKDDGDDNYLFKNHCRTSISARQEKHHHGHSDENAIVSLISGGAVLLNDGGYRSALPSGPFGAYRADYFHNKLIVRKGSVWKHGTSGNSGEALWKHMRNNGDHRTVSTALIDSLKFAWSDFSRTRLTDVDRGYIWDRSLVYLKEFDLFVVIDSVEILKASEFSFSNLWHSQKVVPAGSDSFLCSNDTLVQRETYWEKKAFDNVGEKELLITFPLSDARIKRGTFSLDRNFQEYETLFESISGEYGAGDRELFVTVLVPVEKKDREALPNESLSVSVLHKSDDGIGLAVEGKSGVKDIICLKTNLDRDLHGRDEIPMYDLEHGRMTYGDVVTDGHFTHIRERGDEVHWSCSHMMELKYKGIKLHRSENIPHPVQIKPDDSVRTAPVKWRSWEDSIKFK